jgi:HSP20 family protein
MPPMFNSLFGIDRVADGYFPRAFWTMKNTNDYPYVNVAEYKDEIQVVAEIPGMSKEDVKIELQNDVLVLSGERKAPESTQKGEWLRNEIRYGSFSKTIELPEPVDAEKVTAEYSNGVLRIVLPKAEAAKPREITIR